MRVEQFRDIARKNRDIELTLRNNLKIRKLFAEVIGVLMTSKNMLFTNRVKLSSTTGDEFDLVHMSNKLKAPEVSYVKDFFKEQDPKELFIAVN